MALDFLKKYGGQRMIEPARGRAHNPFSEFPTAQLAESLAGYEEMHRTGKNPLGAVLGEKTLATIERQIALMRGELHSR